MIPNDSRYVNADDMFVTSHAYTAQGRPDVNQDGTVAVHSRDTLYLLTTAQGVLPNNVKRAGWGEDMSDLANEALQDPTKWWVVADANPEIRYPLDLAPSDLVRMPS